MGLSQLILCAFAATASAKYMNCGEAELCGVITLESGFGRSFYKHKVPGIHGLWPQTKPYGSSKCIRPQNKKSPTSIPACYNTDKGVDPNHQLDFVQHEWTKHGECAGTVDSADFFNQLCTLTRDPLAIMTKVRHDGGNLLAMAQALRKANYPVWTVDSSGAADQQLQLSACAKDGKWVIADVDDFDAKCGGGAPRPPSPPSPPVQQCVKGQHGPRCADDDDCKKYKNCVRCARSGFCTDLPLFVSRLDKDAY